MAISTDDNKPAVKHEAPIGSSGTDVVGRIHNQDDHIDSLKGSEAASFYDKMRRSDPQIRKVISAVNYPIKAAEWSVEQASDDPKDIEVAAVIDQILFKDISFSKFLHEALTFFFHGFSVFEIIHANKIHKELGPYTGLAQLGFRKQNTITEWTHDQVTGKLLSIKQEATGDIEVNAIIPAEFLLNFFNEQEGDNIGFPLGRVLFGPYKRKLLATELQYIGTERFAIPTPILKVPKKVSRTDKEYIDAAEVLKGFTSAEDSFIMFPEGWDLTLHNNVFDPTKLNSLIKSEDEKMTGAILATFLELGIGGNSGAFALGNDLSDFFLNGLEAIANTVRDTVNICLIPSLVRLNYGDEIAVLPRLVYSGVSDKAGKEIMEIVTGYVAGGVITKDEQLEDHVRKIHKLPKKAEGTILDNGETEDNNNTPPKENTAPPQGEIILKLAEDVGHTHEGTGPAIQRGLKHYHELLDSKGESIGRTKTEKSGAGHVHEIEGGETGKPKKTKEVKELSDNPKTLIEKIEPEVTGIIRRNLKNISDKFINDILKNYQRLGDKQKLNALKGVKVGGVNAFKKELKSAFTGAAKQSLRQVRKEIPSKADVKLGYDMDALRLKFDNADSFKFTDFSELPRRLQLLVFNEADLISAKESRSVTDTVAFQFNSSESSTKDIDVLRADLEDAADTAINSGTKDTVAATATSTIVNDARNEFLFSPEVVDEIASVTFVNSDPKAAVCIALAGSVYNVNDTGLVRNQPPLHQNCKSYLRANLKTSDNLPDVTGLPALTDTELKSITLGDNKK